MGIAGKSRHLSGHQIIESVKAQQADQALQQRGLHMLATAGSRALVQRGDDAERGEDAGQQVGERQAGPHRAGRLGPGDAHPVRRRPG